MREVSRKSRPSFHNFQRFNTFVTNFDGLSSAIHGRSANSSRLDIHSHLDIVRLDRPRLADLFVDKRFSGFGFL